MLRIARVLNVLQTFVFIQIIFNQQCIWLNHSLSMLALLAGGGLTASQDGSPSKGSPTKRGAAAGQSGLLARAFG